MVKDVSILDLACHVFPGKLTQYSDYNEIYEKTYNFWKSIYEDVYSKSGHISSLNPDNFLLQDDVLALTYDSEVVGCILLSYHLGRLRISTDINYFKGIPQEFVDQIRTKISDRFMLMESLTVHPEWRKSQAGVSLAHYLIGFAIHAFKSSRADILVGTPRVDVKVDRILNMFGGKDLGNFTKSNYPCKTFIFTRESLILNPVEIDTPALKRIWNNRYLHIQGEVA